MNCSADLKNIYKTYGGGVMQRFFCLSLSLVFVLGAALSPHITKEKSTFLQSVKDAFHYFSGDTERPKAKKYPEKFEKDIKKQIRYPRKSETK